MKRVVLYLINKYKKYISPIFEHFGVKCKYYPTCSEYMKQAIIKYGVLHGLYLGMKRFLKCNPFSKGGYDPVNKRRRTLKIPLSLLLRKDKE